MEYKVGQRLKVNFFIISQTVGLSSVTGFFFPQSFNPIKFKTKGIIPTGDSVWISNLN